MRSTQLHGNDFFFVTQKQRYTIEYICSILCTRLIHFFYFFQLNWDRKWDAQVPASCFLLRWCKSGTIDSLEKGKAHGWFLIILFSHMICSCIIVCSFNKYIGQYSYTGGLVTDSLFHYQYGKKMAFELLVPVQVLFNLRHCLTQATIHGIIQVLCLLCWEIIKNHHLAPEENIVNCDFILFPEIKLTISVKKDIHNYNYKRLIYRSYIQNKKKLAKLLNKQGERLRVKKSKAQSQIPESMLINTQYRFSFSLVAVHRFVGGSPFPLSSCHSASICWGLGLRVGCEAPRVGP
jgi:hypothetical protein